MYADILADFQQVSTADLVTDMANAGASFSCFDTGYVRWNLFVPHIASDTRSVRCSFRAP
jgi:hypothetical protein